MVRLSFVLPRGGLGFTKPSCEDLSAFAIPPKLFASTSSFGQSGCRYVWRMG
jgi:hypothetical protein